MTDRSILTIGNFDGVHVGHRALIQHAAKHADQRQLQVTAVTFDPHPITVLRPDKAPQKLSTIECRFDLLKRQGVDKIVVLKPTKDLLKLSPRQFVEQMVQKYKPEVIIEGANFRFGQDRKGDVELLASLGRELGFETEVIDPVVVGLTDQLTVTVSSSLLRWLLSHGRVADAAHCLDRLYELRGNVVKGAGQGASLGVKTANVDLESLGGLLIPPDGVYAGHTQLDNDDVHATAISIGTKPTLGSADRSPVRVLEAHLLDFDGDLYQQQIRIRFSRWLRDQQAFADIDLLRLQIQRDISMTRSWHELGLLVYPQTDQQPVESTCEQMPHAK